MVFNRSHYEDVLVARVHDLVPRDVWSARYEMINDFEAALCANGTRILKFYLHISPEEQLKRFADRLDDAAKNWKISETGYSERRLWGAYTKAYEEMLAKTSTPAAPWFVIPSDKKWFRNLAIAGIITETLDDMGLHLPATRVDLADIRMKYHQAEERARIAGPDAAKDAN